jgi:NAD-dependent SIR2 family protein deacetylase
MSPTSEPLDQLREQANELYWNSTDTVDQLASQLGMSRKAVYSSVQPLPAGAKCVHCGEALVFMNRTSRSSGLASCSACGAQVDTRDLAAAPPKKSTQRGPTSAAQSLAQATNEDVHVVPVPGPQNRWEQIKEDLSAVAPDRAAKIGGAAALGVALGAAAVRVIKKRS